VRSQKTRDAIVALTGRSALTVTECAVLQGFPPSWPFQGATKSSRYRQVGNAVPPRLAEVVGRAIVEAMDARKVYRYDGVMATACLAESLGFEGLFEAETREAPVDRESQEYCEWIDAYESEAIEHIKANGYTVVYP
jgi:hypothetical protein